MKSIETQLSINALNANSSGLVFKRLSVGAPVTWPVAGIGVDGSGNVVPTDAGFRTASLTDVSNSANSSADVTVASVVIPANALTAGTGGQIRAFGVASAGINSTFNLWVKLGSTKVLNAPYSSALLGTLSNAGVMLCAYFTVRSQGTTASIAFSGHTEAIATTIATQIGSQTVTVNTQSAQTIAMGFNWSNASNQNIVTINQCIIGPI